MLPFAFVLDINFWLLHKTWLVVDLTMDTLQGCLYPSHDGRSPVGIWALVLGTRALTCRAGVFMYNKLTANKFIKLNHFNFHVCVYLRE